MGAAQRPLPTAFLAPAYVPPARRAGEGAPPPALAAPSKALREGSRGPVPTFSQGHTPFRAPLALKASFSSPGCAWLPRRREGVTLSFVIKEIRQ